MKPSRTYTLGIACLVSELLLAQAALVAAFTIDVAQFQALAELFATLGMCIAGGSGIGAGGLALRDYGSGGLTSSQSNEVLAAQQHYPNGEDL